VSSENAVFTAAELYASSRGQSLRPEDHRELFKSVRYNLVHPAVLNDIVLTNALIARDAELMVRVAVSRCVRAGFHIPYPFPLYFAETYHNALHRVNHAE
jgi:hypothetical protein